MTRPLGFVPRVPLSLLGWVGKTVLCMFTFHIKVLKIVQFPHLCSEKNTLSERSLLLQYSFMLIID